MKSSDDNLRLYDDCRTGRAEGYEALWPGLYRVAYAMLRELPDRDQAAADCAQLALIKVYQTIASCRTPTAFRAWTMQILRRVVLDELRRPERRRRMAMPAEDSSDLALAPTSVDDLAAVVQQILTAAPLSERSRRVVVGRYFAERSDEDLAASEATLSGEEVRPSHIQVTRSKNLAKLRSDPQIIAQLRELVDP
ncbi:sigma-70 family RNA polymerase sigma factor [Candidatus Gracilibacteria bacterium]|nr:sigma-70 family RNA polymerase sigma factor [Candidatus Gracilibacteria bacterium]